MSIKTKSWWVKSIFLLTFLCALAIAQVMQDPDGIDLSDERMILILKLSQAFSVLFVFIVPAVLFALLVSGEGVGFLRINKPHKMMWLVYGAAIMLAAQPMISALAAVNEMMKLPQVFSGIEIWMKTNELALKQITDAFMRDTAIGGLLLNLFVVAFMAALSEEIFFRAALQQTLSRALKNNHAAIWLAAALFSAFHLQFYGFLPRLLMGAMLGYLFVWSDSVWVPVFTHFFNNAFAVILSFFIKRGNIAKEVENTGATSDTWLLALFSLMIVSGIIYYIRRNNKLVLEVGEDV